MTGILHTLGGNLDSETHSTHALGSGTLCTCSEAALTVRGTLHVLRGGLEWGVALSVAECGGGRARRLTCPRCRTSLSVSRAEQWQSRGGGSRGTSCAELRQRKRVCGAGCHSGEPGPRRAAVTGGSGERRRRPSCLPPPGPRGAPRPGDWPQVRATSACVITGASMASHGKVKSTVAKGSGFWHTPIVTKYSRETQELLKVMMEESKLTMFQQRHLIDCMKRGDPLPTHCSPTSSSQPEQQQTSPPPKPFQFISRVGRPHLRPAKVCQAGDSYVRDKFRPQPTRDLEKEKERLQNIFAKGKEVVGKKPPKKEVKVEEEVSEPDRFDELIKEVRDRQTFLAEMEALGQGRLYQGIILTEISQKLREMELIDKQRSAELKKEMAAALGTGNKPDHENTGQQETEALQSSSTDLETRQP